MEAHRRRHLFRGAPFVKMHAALRHQDPAAGQPTEDKAPGVARCGRNGHAG